MECSQQSWLSSQEQTQEIHFETSQGEAEQSEATNQILPTVLEV
jgi:hypothetical protein